MNGVTVTIGGKDYPLRWEVGPVHEFDLAHPELGGAARAWNNSTGSMDSLFALWCMCLRCRDGSPKMSDSDGRDLLQSFLDEDHDIEDAYDLIGEAGIAGKFYKRIVDPEPEVETSPTTPGDGTTKSSK